MTIEEHNRNMGELASRLNLAPTLTEACERWGVSLAGEFPKVLGFAASVKVGSTRSLLPGAYDYRLNSAFNSDVIEFQKWNPEDADRLLEELVKIERDALEQFANSGPCKAGEFQPQTADWNSRWRWVCEENEVTPDNKDKSQGFFRCVWKIAARPILK